MLTVEWRRAERARGVRFYLPFENFELSGTPSTTGDYVTYRDATLEFIAGRKRRMAEWVTNYHPRLRFVALGGDPISQGRVCQQWGSRPRGSGAGR